MAKSGAQSPTSFSKHLDKTFEEAQYSGVINLNNKNLKEYPKCKKRYDLIDTSTAGKVRDAFPFKGELKFSREAAVIFW